MAIVFILGITAAVLMALRLLPGRAGDLITPYHWLAALSLPFVATYGSAYAVFAAFTVALIAIAPAVGRMGLVLPAPQALELRARLFLFCLPMLPMLIYTIAVSGLTFAQLSFVNLLAIGLLLAMLRANMPIRIARLAVWDTILAIMLVVQIFMDARGNTFTFSARATVIVLLNLGLPYLAVSRAFARAKGPADLLLSLVLSGCILATIAAFESARHWLLYDTMPGLIHADPETISGYTKQRDGLLRARATFGESTGLSLLFGLQVVMLVALRRQLGSRIALAGIAAVLCVGMVFTFARVGYIVIAVGLVACFLYERRWKNLALLGLALPLGGGVLLALAAVVPTIAASVGTSSDAAGSVDYRSRLLSAGLEIVRDHWAFGLDMKHILVRLEPLKTGEQIIDFVNQPLTILMRSGLIGGSLYFLMFVCVLIALFRRGPRLPIEVRSAGGACFAGLIGMMASLTTTSFGRNETTYVILLAAGAGIVARRAAATRPVAIRPPRAAMAMDFAVQGRAMSEK